MPSANVNLGGDVGEDRVQEALALLQPVGAGLTTFEYQRISDRSLVQRLGQVDPSVALCCGSWLALRQQLLAELVQEFRIAEDLSRALKEAANLSVPESEELAATLRSAISEEVNPGGPARVAPPTIEGFVRLAERMRSEGRSLAEAIPRALSVPGGPDATQRVRAEENEPLPTIPTRDPQAAFDAVSPPHANGRYWIQWTTLEYPPFIEKQPALFCKALARGLPLPSPTSYSLVEIPYQGGAHAPVHAAVAQPGPPNTYVSPPYFDSLQAAVVPKDVVTRFYMVTLDLSRRHSPQELQKILAKVETMIQRKRKEIAKELERRFRDVSATAQVPIALFGPAPVYAAQALVLAVLLSISWLRRRIDQQRIPPLVVIHRTEYTPPQVPLSTVSYATRDLATDAVLEVRLPSPPSPSMSATPNAIAWTGESKRPIQPSPAPSLQNSDDVSEWPLDRIGGAHVFLPMRSPSGTQFRVALRTEVRLATFEFRPSTGQREELPMTMRPDPMYA